MDDVTRECLAVVVDTSISGRRVVRELAAFVLQRDKPAVIVSDNREAIRRFMGTGGSSSPPGATHEKL